MSVDAAKCLLCGGAAMGRTYPFGTDWGGRRFDYLRCGKCRSSVLHPLPTDAEFARMYDRAAYHDEYYADTVETDPLTRLDDVAPQFRLGGTMLDFGCGSGGFLRQSAAAGFDSVGVELEESARRHAAETSGRPVFALETLIEAGRKFDVIHLADVLEHLPDPAATMRRLETLLAADGKFFVEGPLEDNASPVLWAASLFGAAKRLAGRPLHSEYPPFHLFRTGARAQRSFFTDRLGYSVERFLVWETGWPYAKAGDRLLQQRSLGGLVRMAIGRTAVGAARVTAPAGLHLGNRFAAVLTPARASPGA